jgi:hypothetical protein
MGPVVWFLFVERNALYEGVIAKRFRGRSKKSDLFKLSG